MSETLNEILWRERIGLQKPRPYLIGLNNPQSSDPKKALWPHDENATGYRLWKMVDDVTTIPLEEWLSQTQRTNLLSDIVLPKDYRSAAYRRGQFLAPLIERRTVILLGSEVATAFGHRAEPFVWAGSWITIPHPSGRNRFYNDPVCRLAAGLLLADVLRLVSAA